MTYPEHDKVKAVMDRSQAIGAFIEWLSHQGYSICAWQDSGDNGEPREIPATPEGIAKLRTEGDHFEARMAERNGTMPNPDYFTTPEGYFPARKSIQDWLALYFDINQDTLEAEKRAMLDTLRKMNGG